MYIGPGASPLQWDAAINKYVTNAAIIRSHNLGLPATIPLYNIHCITNLSYKSSLVAPTHVEYHCETHTLNSLTRSPWQAYPNKLLFNFKTLHLPQQPKSLRLMSLAGRTRNALSIF